MRILTVPLLALCASAMPATAQTLKPGLWEVQNKMGGNLRMDARAAEMQKQMAAMPPEQRRQMEAMMAGRDMPIGRADDGGMTIKICLTREMVQRNHVAPSRGDCRTTRQQRSGNVVRTAFTCTNPPSSGETQVTIDSPESFTSRSNITQTGGGEPEKMTMETRGKWASADCGTVKPIEDK